MNWLQRIIWSGIFVFATGVFLMPGGENGGENGGERVWTVEQAIHIKYPGTTAISPDGKWVVYSVTSPVIGETESGDSTHLWISALDGTGNYQLTNGKEDCYSPRWSPDGKWIAFLSARRSSRTDIWQIRPDGGEAVQLTRTETGVRKFKWSPDSKHIAFLMDDPETEKEKQARRIKEDPDVLDTDIKYAHLYRVRVDTAGVQEARRLTAGAFNVNYFDWRPDGKRIVFSHAATHRRVMQWRFTDISTIPAEGGALTPLVRNPGMDHSPLYSPDGKQVAFVSVRGNRSWGRDFRICRIPADGGTGIELRRQAYRAGHQPNPAV